VRLALLLAACLAACNADASRYRLAGTGSHWDRAGGRPIAEELGEIYPDYFAIILDPSSTREPDLRPLRDDLEARPTQRRSYDALNAIAIGYFELNYRAEASRGGATYLADSFRATKLVAVPWRAYGEIDDGALRDAILAFFEDAASGEKLGTASTAPRLAPIVGSLRAKESDPQRTARIDALVSRLEALTPPPPME
jgi:hypothetical protein